jgi:hypothetical protein
MTGIFSVLNFPAVIFLILVHHTASSAQNLVPSISYLFTTQMGALQFLHQEAGLPPIRSIGMCQ